MGNCVDSSSLVENARAPRNAPYPSKAVSGRSLFSVSSTPTTYSTPSTLSVRSYSDKTSNGSLPTPRTEGEILSSSQLKAFTFNDLKNATRNFRPDSLLGVGGFGYVYKGWIDEQSFSASRPGCGMVVAVKKLKPESFQGHKEWLGVLNHFHGQHESRLQLEQPEDSLFCMMLNLKLYIEILRPPTSFLTQYVFFFRDLEFNAKLSDFGLAKAGPTGDKTHVSTQVIGTHGYAAPEYIATGRLSVKSDVYSFGVVLLELLSGRRAIDETKMGIEQNLVEWAIPYLCDKRKLYRIMDTRLEGQYPKKGAHAIATLALQCIEHETKLRPRMSDALASLEQLQDLKSAAFPLQADQYKPSSVISKSPTRHHH
ncbi:hypothetical protein C4D60_Mb06t11300 [Musa balbisiana]|uniref:Protein kinase domain-containing protein n=1 Tax=Musa balbisiana TaxID=52838 RepID=A0A4V4H3U4_MUSBA|nr:hypothetical protein C4D60_Mb06t11300 [Musa balbisiana]